MESHKLHVTEILQLAGLIDSTQIDEWYLQRGQMVHKACELYDKGILDIESVDDRILHFLSAWKKFRETFGGDIILMEKEVEHPTLGYKGRIDRLIAHMKGIQREYVLIDIKTNTYNPISQLQLEGYRQALCAMDKKKYRGLAIATVVLKPNTEPSVYLHPQSKSLANAWEACIALARWRLSQTNKIPQEIYII